MSPNATLLGQMITFAVFIWFTMKYVWPHITKAMEEREKKIADGLATADRAQRDLELAKHRSAEILQEAKIKAGQIVDQANKRSMHIIEEAKETAREEVKRLLAAATVDIEQQKQQVKTELQQQAGVLALTIAEKIIQREIDNKAHQQLLNNLVEEM